MAGTIDRVSGRVCAAARLCVMGCGKRLTWFSPRKTHHRALVSTLSVLFSSAASLRDLFEYPENPSLTWGRLPGDSVGGLKNRTGFRTGTA